MKEKCLAESFFTGTSKENFICRPRARSQCLGPCPVCRSPFILLHGRMAPSARERFLLGMTSSGSNSSVTPRPAHFSHAPSGLLNEKWLGVHSGRLIWHSSQRDSSLYTRSSPVR